ncbi:MAG: 50S ribosomal protein L11 methyltransferase [Alphaproteobacteria bacterium]|nr:50S ribosomal protein L11 methyltransferase [Alphaproteobacteria bacterium]
MTSKCWQITFHPTHPCDEIFDEFLNNFFEVVSQNYNENGIDEYIGYMGKSFDEQQMLENAKLFCVDLPPYEITELKSENWLKDYVIKFDSFEICDFCIYGIHQETQPKTDKIPLQIYAATAFGSNHQTTQSCIRAISELHDSEFMPTKILDIGTGSGILSLCAAKLWPNSSITAGDIDDEAVIVTTSNAQTNNLSNQIQAVVSDGYKYEVIAKNAPYDLILCNILANPLIAFAKELSQNLKNNGYCILSGFIDEQVQDVITAHEQQGLQLIKLYSLDNWRAALMKKVK